MIIERIVEQHAIEAALLWPLRDAATAQPQYTLARLASLDERIEAHVDGLRIAGDAGWDICKAVVEDDAGAVFAGALLAIERGALQGFAEMLDIGGGEPVLARALVSALGWTEWSNVDAILPGLLDPACPAELHYLGLAACAAHRVDPGEPLSLALRTQDGRLLRRAIEAVGELGRRDLLGAILHHLRDERQEIRFQAAWSAALLGETSVVSVLQEIAEAGGPHAAAALSLAIRRVDAATASKWVETFSSREATRRAAIIAAGARGDADNMAQVLHWMAVPDLARLAGEAFTMITGIDVEAEDLLGAPPEDFQSGPTDEPEDEDVAPDPDEHLPWPDVPAVLARWRRAQADFRPHTRHLLGRPISADALSCALRTGNQRQRAAAAIELALLTPGRPLFEVRAPAPRQARLLWS